MTRESGYTNDGIDGVKAIPVESKEPTLVSTPAEMGKPDARKETLKELVVYDQEININEPPKKKRGRPSKKFLELVKEEDKIEGGLTAISPKLLKEVTPVREWYCSTCREVVNEKTIMKIGTGDSGRYAAFCGMCQRSLGFIQPDLDEKVANLIKNNPTGK